MVLLPKNDPQTYRDIESMARSFATEVIRPVSETLDRDETFPELLYEEMAKLGLFGITVPGSLGGAGMDCLA